MEWQWASLTYDQSCDPSSTHVLFPVPSCHWSKDEHVTPHSQSEPPWKGKGALWWWFPAQPADPPLGVRSGHRTPPRLCLRARISLRDSARDCQGAPAGAGSVSTGNHLVLSPLIARYREFSPLYLYDLAKCSQKRQGWRVQTLSYTFAFRKTTGHKIL